MGFVWTGTRKSRLYYAQVCVSLPFLEKKKKRSFSKRERKARAKAIFTLSKQSRWQSPFQNQHKFAQQPYLMWMGIYYLRAFLSKSLLEQNWFPFFSSKEHINLLLKKKTILKNFQIVVIFSNWKWQWKRKKIDRKNLQ